MDAHERVLISGDQDGVAAGREALVDESVIGGKEFSDPLAGCCAGPEQQACQCLTPVDTARNAE
jgi:hypothetical protein